MIPCKFHPNLGMTSFRMFLYACVLVYDGRVARDARDIGRLKDQIVRTKVRGFGKEFAHAPL